MIFKSESYRIWNTGMCFTHSNKQNWLTGSFSAAF